MGGIDDPDWIKQQNKDSKVTRQRAREYRERALRFVWGGLSGFAATLWVQPMSLIKVRMQMTAARVKVKNRPTAIQELNSIVNTCGFICLYRGLSANVTRQLSYTSTRLGIYYMLIDIAKEKRKKIPFAEKCVYGSIAGACGGFLSVPSEIAFVRMIADDKLSFNIRRNYVHVGQAMLAIARNEGIFALWKGGFPTICRGMIMNATVLGVYSEMKEKLKLTKKFSQADRERLATAYSSLVAGVVSAIVVAPIDLIKTRMQTSFNLIVANEYNGALDCFFKIVREEGFFSLWRGFTPAVIQNIPYTLFLFLLYEEFSRVYSQH